MSKTIEVHIDELVLHGFSPHDRYRISDAMQAAIYDHIVGRGLPAAISSGGFISTINAGSFDLSSPIKPAGIGEKIATTVYNSFSNEG